MVLVAQGSNWWIESFTVARANIANQAERVTAHTLSRGGVLLAASATMDHDIAASLVTGLCLVVRSLDDSALVIGETISGIETVFMNDSGAGAIVGETVMVILRSG